MKAISLKQPWASMIANGQKTIETRTWPTRYRGPLIIAASAKPKLKGFPVRRALCVAELVDCRPMTKADEERACCEVYAGAYAWVLVNVRRIEPFKVKGQLGLFDVPGVNFCKLCGLPIAESEAICGECACEDDGF